MDEEAYWQSTPLQAVRKIQAYRDIKIREHNERAWIVWHMAALSRTKKLPELKKLLHQEPRRRQTWQEQLEIAKMWAKVTRTRIYSTDQDNP